MTAALMEQAVRVAYSFPSTGGNRRFPKGDRKALWPPPQRRNLCAAAAMMLKVGCLSAALMEQTVLLIFQSLQPEGPKVSKGRSESPLAASTEAESLRCGRDDADGGVTVAALMQQTGRVYCSFSLRERTKEHPRGVTPLGHLPFTVLRDSMGVSGQLKTAPCALCG